MKKKKSNPTPLLGKPSSRHQHFTVEQIRMLDQITLEIQDAWKDDLLKMREYYKQIRESQMQYKECEISIKDIQDKLSDQLEQVQRLTSSSGIIDLLEVLEKQKQLAMFMDEIRKEVFDMKNQLKFESIQDILKHTKAIKDLLESINKSHAQKKWWEFWKY